MFCTCRWEALRNSSREAAESSGKKANVAFTRVVAGCALLLLSPAPGAGLADGLVVRLHRYDDIKHEKLFDNSYETHSSLTGESYGGKAAEILIKTQGKSFRHEKTKKKRGTYRGGQISMASNSIKFED